MPQAPTQLLSLKVLLTRAGNLIFKSSFFWTLLSILFISQTRFIARDEGFYLYSAKLILSGKLPYRDFFLPQAPVMPYLYSGWFWLTSTSWISARICAALIAIGAAWIAYLLARHIYDVKTARIASLMLAVTPAFQLWIPIAKNTGLASLFFLLSLYFFIVQKKLFVAAVFMGACVATRFTFAPLCLLLFVPIGDRRYWRQLISVVTGLAPLAVLLAIFIWLSGDNFIQDNFTYHTQRSRLSAEGVAANKLAILTSLLSLSECIGGGGPQFLLLLVGGFSSLFYRASSAFGHQMLLLAALVFAGASFIPTPTYVQYFCVVALLLLPPTAHTALRTIELIKMRTQSRLTALILSTALAIGYLYASGPDFYRFLLTGDKVIGVGAPHHHSWRLASVSKVSLRIDQLNLNHKPVYSAWPGYLLESQSAALLGTENSFGVNWAEAQDLSEQDAQKLRIKSHRSILSSFQNNEIDLAILITRREKESALSEQLINSGAKNSGRLGIVAFISNNAPR